MEYPTSITTNATTNPMNYALQVALQTMKERCIQLQRRIQCIEDENLQLRERDNRSSSSVSVNGGAAECFQLRIQIAELQHQKVQLTEHINMVADENRKLWSRLSQLSKEPVNKETDIASTSEVSDSALSSPRGGSSGASQNLIRSKTFTQHSPNPNLRQKVISGGLKDISLEEVALGAYGEHELVTENTFVPVNGKGFDFGYLNVDETTLNDPNYNTDAKKCIEGLQQMRREAMKQQQELNSTLTMLESRITLQPCAECAQKAEKPEMADKSLETDESLNELKYYNNTSNQIVDDSSQVNGHNYYTSTTPSRLNIIQEKIKADDMDKTCPMCGKIYTNLVTFKAFREHVEMHFIDDSSDVDNSMDRNFEIISHTVGDF